MSEPSDWLRVDMRGMRSRSIGPVRGIAPAVERRWRMRGQRARDEVRQAHHDGVLPHGQWWKEGAVDPREVTLPLMLLGEPGAVRAATLGVREKDLHVSSWAVDFEGTTIRVDGGPHLPGTGDPNEDLRFGVFGPVAEGIRRAVLGDAAGAVSDAIQAAAASCAEPVNDPALDLTAALLPAAFEASTVVMFVTPECMAFAQWWAGVLTAVTCKPSTDGPSQVARGLDARVVELGDEAAMQAAIYADPTPLVVAVSAGRQEPAVAAMRDATRAIVLRAGHPYLDVRLGSDAAEQMLPAAWVALESALAIAVAVGVEPLTLIPGEDLRLQLDSGGGAPT